MSKEQLIESALSLGIMAMIFAAIFILAGFIVAFYGWAMPHCPRCRSQRGVYRKPELIGPAIYRCVSCEIIFTETEKKEVT